MAQRKSRQPKKTGLQRKRDVTSRTSKPTRRTAPGIELDGRSPENEAVKALAPAKATAGARSADAHNFAVVALGASLGGLEALELFFSRLPADPNMGFVVITHQAPDHESLLPQLLARNVSLPVSNIEEGMPLAPNQIYVTPAGSSVVFEDDHMHLEPLERRPSGALPIDASFRSLARAYGERAIAVVLSGTGSDGSLGLIEIKNAFGMTLAQDPQTTESRGMPSNAIATQLVDYVLAPAEMPEQIARYVRSHLFANVDRFSFDKATDDSALQNILAVLRARTSSDFSAYKKSTIRRRVERRMHVHNISSPDEYAAYLESTAFEVDALFRELLISVTSFFRDDNAFQVLAQELTKLVELKTDGQQLRVWIAGCATGEEAYSIAILLREVLDASGKELKVQLFATDLDHQAVDVARIGRYPEGIAADVSPERLKRFFTREDTRYRVNKDVREMIIFAVQNVIKDPPFTKLDLVTCRNLLIYLETSLQRRVLSFFSYSLRPGGILLLGTSESVSGFDDRFVALDKRWKIFQRLSNGNPLTLPEFFHDRPTLVGESHGIARDGQRGAQGVSTAAERVLLASFVPPTVLMTERGDIIYVQGRVGMFLEPAQGEPTQNIFSMAREGLRVELPAAVRKAANSNQPVVRSGLLVKTNGHHSTVTMIVRQLTEPASLRGNFLVSFETAPQEEATTSKRTNKKRTSTAPERLTVLEEELQRTRENLQGMIEELETSNEELKSTNEELQSTNEELQSTNEELETSREEMQSLNEELQTVNTELEERNRALTQASDDMQNLLNSTEVATVFLDDKLHIKRFTTQAKKVFSLIDTDIGRPISDLAANLRYDGLLSEAKEVLDSLVFREREIQTKEGAWRLMRIMPYRTHENLIDGLVMTFVDIDRLKGAQRSAKRVRLDNNEIVDSVATGLLVVDVDQRVVMLNRAFCDMFGIAGSNPVGQPLAAVALHAEGLPQLDALCNRLLYGGPEDQKSVPKARLTAPGFESSAVSISGRRLLDHPDQPARVLLMFDLLP